MKATKYGLSMRPSSTNATQKSASSATGIHNRRGPTGFGRAKLGMCMAASGFDSTCMGHLLHNPELDSLARCIDMAFATELVVEADRLVNGEQDRGRHQFVLPFPRRAQVQLPAAP